MKTLSQLFESKQLEIQDDTLNFIPAEQLEQYLVIAKEFISKEAKFVVRYLITNNSTYIDDLGDGTDKNALAVFYEKPAPSDEEKRELHHMIGVIAKRERLLEIPVFQTREQFEGILNKDISPDEVLLDLTTDEGRTKVIEQYKPLIKKMVNQYHGKSRLTDAELESTAYFSLLEAMERYGKKRRDTDSDEELKKRKSYTFTKYATFMIRNNLLEDIKQLSHIVRIPVSQQQKERRETGRNTKDNTVSGDRQISTGSSKSEGNEKTLFDLIGDRSASTRSIDQEDLDSMFAELFRKLEEHFDKKTMDIWYSCMGLNGHKKVKNKEIAKKYNVVPSNVSYYCTQVNKYIQKNKTLFSLICDIRDLMAECHAEWDDDDDEPRRITVNENNVIDDDE